MKMSDAVSAPATDEVFTGGKKILLIDDDLTLSEMYDERLKAAGYRVAVVHDGQSGLEQAKAGKPDLILLDIMLPKMNGLDVLQQLKSDEETSATPVILLTALIQELDKVKGKAEGAADYYVKSDTLPGDLVKRIDNFFKKQENSEEDK
jgi:two-component system alkaline phosphatase synthesis response regulator PhoP